MTILLISIHKLKSVLIFIISLNKVVCIFLNHNSFITRVNKFVWLKSVQMVVTALELIILISNVLVNFLKKLIVKIYFFFNIIFDAFFSFNWHPLVILWKNRCINFMFWLSFFNNWHHLSDWWQLWIRLLLNKSKFWEGFSTVKF
jgi:hypothetical protein